MTDSMTYEMIRSTLVRIGASYEVPLLDAIEKRAEKNQAFAAVADRWRAYEGDPADLLRLLNWQGTPKLIDNAGLYLEAVQQGISRELCAKTLSVAYIRLALMEGGSPAYRKGFDEDSPQWQRAEQARKLAWEQLPSFEKMKRLREYYLSFTNVKEVDIPDPDELDHLYTASCLYRNPATGREARKVYRTTDRDAAIRWLTERLENSTDPRIDGEII